MVPRKIPRSRKPRNESVLGHADAGRRYRMPAAATLRQAKGRFSRPDFRAAGHHSHNQARPLRFSVSRGGDVIIEFFGPPGSGKTTLSLTLADRLREHGFPASLRLSARPGEEVFTTGRRND